MESVEELRSRHLARIAGAGNEVELEEARLAAFGRKAGEVNSASSPPNSASRSRRS